MRLRNTAHVYKNKKDSYNDHEYITVGNFHFTLTSSPLYCTVAFFLYILEVIHIDAVTTMISERIIEGSKGQSPKCLVTERQVAQAIRNYGRTI